MTIQALRERANQRAQEIRDLVAANNDKWTPEHQAKYDEGMAEIEDVKAQITRLQASNEALADQRVNDQLAEAAARRTGGAKAGDEMAELYNKWLRNGDGAITAAEWQKIRATMSTTTPSEGGFTVQTEVAKRVVDALKAYGGMRAVATVLQTAMGNPINFPTSDGTTETGELIGENATATDLDPSFGSVTLSTYKYSSKVVAAPIELIQDSQIDVEAFINQRLIKRIGRATNAHFTTGTGTGQPRGVVTAAASGKVGTTGQTTSVVFDDLVDLVHSIDPAYRESGNCRFMMNDATLRNIRKLKDSQGRPIFLPGYDGLAGAMADSVLGYGVQVNQDMAVMAANAKSILFGDFSYYTIRDVMDVTMFRFADSAYVKKGQFGFLMWARSGGQFVGFGNEVKYYQNSAT